MPPVGKITVTKIGNDTVYSDEAGQTWTLPGPSDSSFRLDIDPRIDLTKPIYEQVLRLASKDKAAAARAKNRRRKAAVA